MYSIMNNPQSDDINNLGNFLLHEEFIDKTDDTTTIVDQKDNKYNTDIKMDSNCINDTNDISNVLNSWASGGDTTEDEIGFQDDNLSHVGSDYSEFQLAELDNPFAQPNPPDPFGGDFNEDELKYNPSELMLRPPSGSAMHFNYNFPAMPSQTETPPPESHVQRSSTMATNTQLPYLYGEQANVGNSCSGTAVVGPASSNYSTNSHSNPECFHPNMWYPNAPFGTYRSYGSQAYGRHYGPQTSHDHTIDMFQLSNR